MLYRATLFLVLIASIPLAAQAEVIDVSLEFDDGGFAAGSFQTTTASNAFEWAKIIDWDIKVFGGSPSFTDFEYTPLNSTVQTKIHQNTLDRQVSFLVPFP